MGKRNAVVEFSVQEALLLYGVVSVEIGRQSASFNDSDKGLVTCGIKLVNAIEDAVVDERALRPDEMDDEKLDPSLWDVEGLTQDDTHVYSDGQPTLPDDWDDLDLNDVEDKVRTVILGDLWLKKQKKLVSGLQEENDKVKQATIELIKSQKKTPMKKKVTARKKR